MWLYSVFFLIVGISMMIIPVDAIQDNAFDSKEVDIKAVNYIQYRNAVRQYIIQNPNHSGNIALSDLSLPTSWNNLGPWKSHASSKIAYAYGDVSPGVEGVVMDKLKKPINTGIKSNNKLVSQASPYKDGSFSVTNDVSLPSNIPEGSLVSVFQVNQ